MKTEDIQINNNNKKKSKKGLIIFFLSLIIIIISVLILWLCLFNKEDKKDDTTDQEIKDEIKDKEKEEIKEEETSNIIDEREKVDVLIKFYKSIDSDYIQAYNSNEEVDYFSTEQNYTNIGSYQCYSKDCVYKSGANNKVVIYDEDFILYDIDKHSSKKLDLNVDFDQSIFMISIDKKVYGLQVSNGAQTAFYNLDSNKYVTDFKYNYFVVDGALKQGNIIASINNYDEKNDNYTFSYYILDQATGKVKYTYNNVQYVTGLENNGHLYYLVTSLKDTFNTTNSLYSDNFILLVNDVSQVDILGNGNYMIKNIKNGFSIYDSKGNLVKESKEYNEVKLVVNDYVAVIDKGYLKLVDSNEKEVASFTKWDDNKYFHDMISGYFIDRGAKVYGVYLVVEDYSIPEGTKGHGKDYYYGTETGEKGVIELDFIGGYAKPLLYLYPKDRMLVNVTFDNPNNLTTTYPKYQNGWSLKASPNGDLYDQNGKYYYGLYWEEEQNHDVSFSEGFYVTKDDAINFLEEKLSIIGLNEREANEFIMYWLPILEKNNQSIVYFELTDERNAYNKLNISPKPDSLLRMAMHVKKVDHKVDIKEQKLISFKRTGFNAIEWGGVIH